MSDQAAAFEHISKLAEKRSAAKLRIEHMGTMNTADTSEKRIAQDAHYKMATDAFGAADAAYRAAISKLSADELNDLVHWQNQKSF